MNNSMEAILNQWCKNHKWTNLFLQEEIFYAFPPGAVIPLPIPIAAIESAKTIREAKILIFKRLFIATISTLLVIFYKYFDSTLFSFISLILIIGVFTIFLRKIWNWLCFISLWLNSR